jgi:aquaporin related protein
MTKPLRSLLPLHHKPAPAASGLPKNGNHPHTDHPKRSGWITNRWRNELVAALAEFAGTFMFLFFAFGGTQVANTAAIYSDAATAGQKNNSITQTPNTSVLLYISLVFGFSLMVNVWVFFRVSGGLFNPAVSFVFSVHGRVRLGVYIGHERCLLMNGDRLRSVCTSSAP